MSSVIVYDQNLDFKKGMTEAGKSIKTNMTFLM